MPPSDPHNRDLTPESAAPTDIAPLGRDTVPAHERTADEEKAMADWDAIAADPDFKSLLASKARFIVPATVFFLAYYLALPILVGWFPSLMTKEAFGGLNWAYVFAFSQFIMAWVVAFLYVAAAAGWDKQAAALLAKFRR